MLDRLMADAEDRLASARSLPEHERELVVDDLRGELTSLRSTAAILRPELAEVDDDDEDDDDEFEDFEFHSEPVDAPPLEPGEVSCRRRGPTARSSSGPRAAGARRRRTTSCRPVWRRSAARRIGWQVHPSVVLPGGIRADALAIRVKDALGWLVADRRRSRPRRRRGQRAVARARRARRGSPGGARGRSCRRFACPATPQGRTVDARRCDGGRRSLDSPAIAALAAAMPGTVAALGGGDGQATTIGGGHRRRRGDRRRERRAHGAAGRAAERQHADGPRATR